MKCPKCNYTSFEYLDNCTKCGKDLIEFKEIHGINVREPQTLNILKYIELENPSLFMKDEETVTPTELNESELPVFLFVDAETDMKAEGETPPNIKNKLNEMSKVIDSIDTDGETNEEVEEIDLLDEDESESETVIQPLSGQGKEDAALSDDEGVEIRKAEDLIPENIDHAESSEGEISNEEMTLPEIDISLTEPDLENAALNIDESEMDPKSEDEATIVSELADNSDLGEIELNPDEPEVEAEISGETTPDQDVASGLDLGEIELNFDEPEVEAEISDETTPDQDVVSDSDLGEIELNFDEPEVEVEISDEATPDQDVISDSDLGEIELNFNEPEVEVEISDEAAPDQEVVSDSDLGEIELNSDEPEVGKDISLDDLNLSLSREEKNNLTVPLNFSDDSPKANQEKNNQNRKNVIEDDIENLELEK